MHSNYEAFYVRATTWTMPKVPSDGFRNQHLQAFISKFSSFYFKERVSTMPKVSSDGFRLP
jgi:hypothetical protein